MKELICIVCPNSCRVEIDEKTKAVTGNKCKRGVKFAIDEITMPMRTISTTVKTSFHEVPVIPVRVSDEIPKEKIFSVMAEINSLCLDKIVKRGEPVIKNVLGLGVDVIATSDIMQKI